MDYYKRIRKIHRHSLVKSSSPRKNTSHVFWLHECNPYPDGDPYPHDCLTHIIKYSHSYSLIDEEQSRDDYRLLLASRRWWWLRQSIAFLLEGGQAGAIILARPNLYLIGIYHYCNCKTNKSNFAVNQSVRIIKYRYVPFIGCQHPKSSLVRFPANSKFFEKRY